MLTVATRNLGNFLPGADAGPTSQTAYDERVAHLKACGQLAADGSAGLRVP